MTAADPQLAAVVAREGALPMPVGVKPFQTVPPKPSDLDVPLHRLEADLRAHLALRQAAAAAGIAAEARHLMDVLDHDFERLPLIHPEACSTSADYPDFHPGGGA